MYFGLEKTYSDTAPLRNLNYIQNKKQFFKI